MAILIKHGDKYYEIPEDVLVKSGLTKEQFEERLKKMGDSVADGPVASRDHCNFIDLSVCRVDD